MRKKFREFIQSKKAIRTGCAVLAAVIVVSGGTVAYQGYQNSQIPELTQFTDPIDGSVTIEEDETPLTTAPKVTTKTSSKTTKKVAKLKSASKKTYTKTMPTTKKTSVSTKKYTKSTVKTQTTKATTVKYKYWKNSKYRTTYTTVKTTVKTTTTPVAAASTTSSTKKQTISVQSAAPKVDSRVSKAFQTLGFTITVDPSVNYSGYFNASKQSITLRKNDGTGYHELGHFLAFIAGNVDTKSEFVSIYKAEKSKYTAINKAYATQNSSEYFAESFKNYTENPSALKSQRPKTYAFIVSTLNKVTDAQVSKVQKAYKNIWK